MGPEEPGLIARYARLNATRLRSTWGAGGLLLREVFCTINGATEWFPILSADEAMSSIEQQDRVNQAVTRAITRLHAPSGFSREQLGGLTLEQKRIIALSNTQFNSEFPNGVVSVPPAFGPGPPSAAAGPSQ